MNAILPLPECQEERIERHLSMCREMAELGMDLVRGAARNARRQQANEEQSLETRAEQEDAAVPKGRAAPKTPDAVQQFNRLCATVRQIVALEARIAIGTARRQAAGSPAAAPPPDPRRPILTRCLDEMTSRHPDRKALRRTAAGLIDQELAADPEAQTPLPDLVGHLCEHLGISTDLAHVSDEILEILFPPGPEPPELLEPAEFQKLLVTMGIAPPKPQDAAS